MKQIQLKESGRLGAAIGLLLLLLVFVNALSRNIFTNRNLDLTEDKLYSISDGTKKILNELPDTLRLKFYFSRQAANGLPALGLYADRIRDLLNEYRTLSGGKIILETFDPQPDTEEEEWAEKYGLQAIAGPNGEKLFLGLAAVNSTGGESSIPMFNLGRQELLEYDLTKLIYSLSRTNKPSIGILSGLDIKGKPFTPYAQNPEDQAGKKGWFFVSQLSEVGDVRFIDPKANDLGQKLDVLVLLHPKDLSDQMLFAIDQHVMHGGKLLALVDPYCAADAPPPDKENPFASAMASRASDLNKLIKNWGLEVIAGKVVGDPNLATKAASGQGSPPVDFLLWLSVNAQQRSAEDPITNGLENVLLPWAGAIKVTPTDGVKISPLLFSSKEAALVEEREYRFGGGNPDSLLRTFKPGTESLPMAVRVSGKLKSAFPDGAPKADSAVAQAPVEAVKESVETNLVLVADVDFLSDQFSLATQDVFGTQLVSLLNDNQALFFNAVENLSGSDAMMSIRSKGRFSRPFTKVQEIEHRAQQRWLQEEQTLTAKLEQANRRLQELQAGTGGPNQNSALSGAMLEEVKKFRDEKRETQQRLREIRRKSREELEGLEQLLFLLNTFLLPAIIFGASVFWYRRVLGGRKKA